MIGVRFGLRSSSIPVGVGLGMGSRLSTVTSVALHLGMLSAAPGSHDGVLHAARPSTAPQSHGSLHEQTQHRAWRWELRLFPASMDGVIDQSPSGQAGFVGRPVSFFLLHLFSASRQRLPYEIGTKAAVHHSTSGRNITGLGPISREFLTTSPSTPALS